MRVASPHVPVLERCGHSDFGEIEFRAGNGGALIFQCGNLVATQFHPEKSQSNRRRLLQNFIGYVADRAGGRGTHA